MQRQKETGKILPSTSVSNAFLSVLLLIDDRQSAGLSSFAIPNKRRKEEAATEPAKEARMPADIDTGNSSADKGKDCAKPFGSKLRDEKGL